MDEPMEFSMPEATPAFRGHFTDAVYSDQGGEFAPFGSDEGSDILYDWATRRDELTDTFTIARIMEMSDADLAQELGDPDLEFELVPAVVGAGFTLLYLTGRIGQADKTLMIKMLGVLIDRYGPQPELLRQRVDLETWSH